MKRKIEKVNSEAGTLKQSNSLVRNGMRIPAKLAAFFLMFSLALTNMSFVQDTDSVIKNDSNTTASVTDANDTCCDVNKAKVAVGTKKILKLYNLPSAEMIRKSDSEANNNLAYSLTENRIKSLKALIANSDAEISERFKNETSVQTSGLIKTAKADETIANLFVAENLSIDTRSLGIMSDKAINHAFEKENYGITGYYTSTTHADDVINKQFNEETARISVPSADHFQIADADMQNLYQTESQQLVINNN